MSFTGRPANPADGEAMLALMPRLAAFELPESRTAEHLWMHDAALLQRWIDGETDNCLVHVVETEAGEIAGFAMATLRPELLSHEPSAHLEAIAVGAGLEGRGIGKMLLRSIEDDALARGALTMTLHVFSKNGQARAFYQKSGYNGELMRYIKPLES